MFPPEIEQIILNYRTCEFTTLTKNQTPSTHPVTAWYQPGADHITITTSIGFPHKIDNIRRNPRVALLFSNPTGSGLPSGGAVMIQGDATPDDHLTVVEGLEDFWQRMFAWQPRSKAYHKTKLSRYLFDWYYIRVQISVTPRRVLYWPTADMTYAPQEMAFNAEFQ